MLLLTVVPSQACFGPKLYLGVGSDATDQVLVSLVAIYVKETTGTDVVRVPLAGRRPAQEIVAEQIDFAFVNEPAHDLAVLMQIDALPVLVSGDRIVTELQFTTVRPTLERFARRLSAADVSALVKKVEDGGMAMDVVRHFLIERRWI